MFQLHSDVNVCNTRTAQFLHLAKAINGYKPVADGLQFPAVAALPNQWGSKRAASALAGLNDVEQTAMQKTIAALVGGKLGSYVSGRAAKQLLSVFSTDELFTVEKLTDADEKIIAFSILPVNRKTETAEIDPRTIAQSAGFPLDAFAAIESNPAVVAWFVSKFAKSEKAEEVWSLFAASTPQGWYIGLYLSDKYTLAEIHTVVNLSSQEMIDALTDAQLSALNSKMSSLTTEDVPPASTTPAAKQPRKNATK